MKAKKYFIATIICLCALLFAAAAFVFAVDPYFHYHGPLQALQYPLNNERYQNDGIGKHFDFDAVITGTSMAENFKVSEMNELFGVDGVKLCYSGASFKEIGERLETALDYHPQTKLIIRCLDYYKLTEDKDHMEYDSYPDYLYDRNPFNDVRYLLDKNTLTVCRDVITYTAAGNKTTDFDDYSAWREKFDYGYDAVMESYDRPKTCAAEQNEYTAVYESIVHETLEQNVLSNVKAHPDTEFIFYLPPYGLAGWDNLKRIGNLKIVLEAQRQTIKELTAYDNVKVFAFLDCFDMITDFDNYMDTSHYGPWINDWMLQCFASGEHEITAENCDAYCDLVNDYYLNLDYDSYFSE